MNHLFRALICYLHNPKIFFLEIPQGPLGISIGNIRSAQKAFRVPQSSVFCHFPCFIEISPKIGICSQSRIFWPIFKCHTILESYRQHGRRATLQVKIRGLNKELWAIQEKNLTFYSRNIWIFFSQINPYCIFFIIIIMCISVSSSCAINSRIFLARTHVTHLKFGQEYCAVKKNDQQYCCVVEKWATISSFYTKLWPKLIFHALQSATVFCCIHFNCMQRRQW